MTYSADAFFDFDKSIVKPEGQEALDKLVKHMEGVDIEVIIATGHTDWTGTEEYNQALSIRRAEAVKAYMVSKGVDPNRFTPRARASCSRLPLTKPAKVAPRIAALKSRWLASAKKQA